MMTRRRIKREIFLFYEQILSLFRLTHKTGSSYVVLKTFYL